MLQIAVTGSIGSGKSFILKSCRNILKAKTISSDEMVHQLYKEDEIIFNAVKNLFPDAISKNVIDRQKLGEIVFNDPQKRKTLQDIVYPRLRSKREELLKLYRRQGVRICFFEIPLLFENNMQKNFDYVITVYCSKYIQKQRVLKRKKMSGQKFNAILAAQMPVSKKLAKSSFAINTGRSKAVTLKKLIEIYRQISESKFRIK